MQDCKGANEEESRIRLAQSVAERSVRKSAQVLRSGMDKERRTLQG